MKKHLLLSAFLLVNILVNGQAIPNSDFENWTVVPYSEPVGWNTSNSESVPGAQVVTATQVAGFSGSAIHLETTLNGSDTIGAYIGNTLGDPLAAEGGVPYSQQASTINGYYRYNLPGNDTALLLVIFKSGGSMISFDIFPIRGTGSQPVFTSFSYPLSLAATPDSVIIAAASSNLLNNIGVEPGSWLELDQLSFGGTGITQQIPGGDFDAWNNLNYDIPQGWKMLSRHISKTTDSFSGTFALKMTNVDEGSGTQPTGISTGDNTNGNTSGGYPYTAMSDTLIGYYKYVTSGTDSVSISLTTTANGSQVGGNFGLLPPVSSYTRFAIPFSSFTTPDTLRIDIYSSTYPFQNIADGSELFIDKLELASLSSGISQINAPAAISVYPNPARDYLVIRYLDGRYSGNAEIVNTLGALVKTVRLREGFGFTTVDIHDLPAGMYSIRLQELTFKAQSRFIKL